MLHFKQLSEIERGKIEALWKEDFSQAEIGRRLNRNRSTISREIRRSQESQDYKDFPPRRRRPLLHYNALIAENNAVARSRRKGRKRLINPCMTAAIEDDYAKHWSPEQIAHGDKRVNVCRNTIYTWIFRGLVPKVGHDQIKHYRGRNKRRKGSLAEANREMIKTRSIENRPDIINKRTRLGDWEVDCVLPSRDGRKVIVTFNERLSRLSFMAFASAQSGEALVPVLDTFMSKFGDEVLSLTCDHGTEFANSVWINRVEDTYGKALYFAHAYSPEERGTNENSNGLLRAFLPKKQTFEKYKQSDLQQISYELNTRPRKMHDWKSCSEAYQDEIAKKQSE